MSFLPFDKDQTPSIYLYKQTSDYKTAMMEEIVISLPSLFDTDSDYRKNDNYRILDSIFEIFKSKIQVKESVLIRFLENKFK